MMELSLSSRETLLLNAALNPNADIAAASWREWAGQIELEVAPVPELRLLTAVYEHLSEIAPELPLPQKLRGKARSTFTRNQLIAGTSVQAIDRLAISMPVLISKGLAVCARFGAWSSRQMGDADFYVPYGKLEEAVDILVADGWVPKYGMTVQSLKHRSSLRRDSWNFSKHRGEIDLHWRIDDGVGGERLEREMWETAEPVTIMGKTFLAPSPEFAVILSLHHGFVVGTRGDVFQSLVDCSKWLPACDNTKLAALISATGRWKIFSQMSKVLRNLGLPQTLRAPKGKDRNRTRPSQGPPMRTERRLLRHPLLYRVWELLGRNTMLERLSIRLAGPLSRPLGPAARPRDIYDLRSCDVIDELAGPGWGWPEPEHTAFWSDRADCRLLVPLSNVEDRVFVLTLSDHRLWSRTRQVAVFANGVRVATFWITDGLGDRDFPFIVSRHLLFGPWVELSFRPIDYAGQANEHYALWRTLPVRLLRVYDAQSIATAVAQPRIPSMNLSILKGRQPEADKFARILAIIAASPHKDDDRLPPGFDPVVYVLAYRDLFDAEVDPYQHFAFQGRGEGRAWQ